MRSVQITLLNRLKRLICFVSLFYLSLYLPITVIVYTPGWHLLYSRWNPRCEKVGYKAAAEGIRELSAYMRHQSALTNERWTLKERRHLKDVRRILDLMVLLGLLALVGTAWTANRRRCARFAMVNCACLLLLSCILPAFAVFWRKIFHPVLFSGTSWINTPKDFSFWIMPRAYFKSTMALVLGTGLLVNGIIWMRTRRD